MVVGARSPHEHARAVADLGRPPRNRAPPGRTRPTGGRRARRGRRGSDGERSCGAQLPEAFDDSRQDFDEAVDVGLDGRPSDRDAQGMIGVDAHRREHRRRLEHLRRARRTGVHRDAVLVECEQDRFGFDAVDADAQQVGERAFGARITEPLDPRDGRAPAAARAIRARCRAASSSRSMSAHAAPKPTHAGTSSMPPRRARSCAPPTSNGGHAQPAPHEQRPGALRAAPLVRRHRAQVGAERAEVDRDPTRGRTGVDVHEHAASARRRADGRGRLERADLVVRELRRHQHGVGSERRRAPRPRRTGRSDRRRRRCSPTPARSIASRTHECSTAVVTTWPPSAVARAHPRSRCSPPRCPTT